MSLIHESAPGGHPLRVDFAYFIESFIEITVESTTRGIQTRFLLINTVY
jgi:hypothetical protein